jgi:acyl phosphate:glycerol-3-phosphate acyltransferase
MSSESILRFLSWCLGAYLAGSIPFGLILVRLAGKGDVRAQGSGNIGATNVLRAGGKLLAILTLLLDIAKGFLPVYLARRAGLEPTTLSWVVLSAVSGHIFTPWLGFKGGKGVATALGACLAYHALMVVPALGVFVLLVAVFRYVSLGSVVAAAVLVPTALGLFGPRFSGLVFLPEDRARYLVVAWVLLAGLVIRRHGGNLQRVWAGTESRLFGPPRKGPDDTQA